jgi:hypothetical protein
LNLNRINDACEAEIFRVGEVICTLTLFNEEVSYDKDKLGDDTLELLLNRQKRGADSLAIIGRMNDPITASKKRRKEGLTTRDWVGKLPS